MAAPTISSVLPSEGLSIGETFVQIDGTGFNDEISGGTVKVLFGGVEALNYGVVDSTKVVALTPGGLVGVVDVTVENVTPQPDPDPDLVEPTTVVGGFEYKRPSIATRRDRLTDSAPLIVTRTLIEELKRTVIENVDYDMHPEYVDPLGAVEEQEAQAQNPGLILRGPRLSEDRFRSVNGPFNDPTMDGFNVHVQPVTVRMDFQYVGVGRTSGEAMNLWAALTRYFNRTAFLKVPRDGVDPANGVIEFEVGVTFEERADFRSPSREGVYQFTGGFAVFGVHTVADKLGEGMDTEEIVTDITLYDSC